MALEPNHEVSFINAMTDGPIISSEIQLLLVSLPIYFRIFAPGSQPTHIF